MNLALRGRFLPRNLLLQAEGAERAVRCLARAAVQLAVRAQAVKFDYRGRSAPGQPPPQKSSENLLSAFLHGRVPEGRPCAHPGLPRTPSAVCGDLWRNGGFMDWAAKETSDRALHPSPRRMRPSRTAPDGARRRPASSRCALRRSSVRPRRALQIDSWNRTQLCIITSLCGQNLVAFASARTETEQLSLQ